MNLARAKTREGGPRNGTLRGNFVMQSSAALNNTQEVISGSLIDMAGSGDDAVYRNEGPQGRQFKYSDEDGPMRGARIAEKIQEFYHTK